MVLRIIIDVVYRNIIIALDRPPVLERAQFTNRRDKNNKPIFFLCVRLMKLMLKDN